jgi:RNA polymerase sigma-70 factor (ECF subfamily)
MGSPLDSKQPVPFQDPETAPKSSGPEDWVDLYGDDLFRYALVRVRDPKTAEDIVQETFLAALQSRHQFAGRSSEKSWMVGILKHKVIDHFRKVNREFPTNNIDLSTAESQEIYDEDGHWRLDENSPEDWVNPDRALEQGEFWKTLSRCLSKLSPQTASAFSLRELDELSSDAVCEALKISPANLWVVLHRARMQLRRCLEIHWFGKTMES